jgi:hypothetical protein
MLYVAVDESFDEVVILHVRHTTRKKPVANDPHTGLFQTCRLAYSAAVMTSGAFAFAP